MDMVKITLTDGTTREMTKYEMMCADLTEVCGGKLIMKTEFFEESDL